jgi:hypothetical protein
VTAVADASPRVRLRVAAETAPGGRVLVAVEDLLAVLAGRDDTPTDLDALTGYQPDEPPDRRPRPAPGQRADTAADRVAAAVYSRNVVVLPVSREGARRLGEAAWTTSHLAEQHGPWMTPQTAPGCQVVLDAAHQALAWLAARPEHDLRGAGDPR